MENTPQETFWDHLESLRWALMRVAAVLVVVMVAAFIVMPWLFEHFILAPTTSDFFLYRWLAQAGIGGFAEPFNVEIINIRVATQFTTHISSSFWTALVITFPYLLFETWRFISPALYENERGSFMSAFVMGGGMFFIGCAVGYTVLFPFMFRFLAGYQLSAEIANQISLDSYMGNFLTTIFMMGILFELPLVTWLLSRLGVLSRQTLREYRRHAIVALLVLAAVITPTGDPFTLGVFFLPLYGLYELSIFFTKERKEEEDEWMN